MIKMPNNNEDESTSGHIDFPYLMPMLDMVLILLFFFVIMSNSAQYVFDIKLPNADKSYNEQYAEKQDQKELKLFIKQDCFMIDAETFTDIDLFKEQIVTQTSGISNKNDINITVASDDEVDVQRFLNVMTFLKSSGFEKVNILMKKDN
jgi:biopolymer transport protein ExbD